MVIKINRRPSSEKGTTNNKEGFFMDKKDTTFAVIGCGQFGGSVVEELARQGADVLAIDCNEEVIKKYVNIATRDCGNWAKYSSKYLNSFTAKRNWCE